MERRIKPQNAVSALSYGRLFASLTQTRFGQKPLLNDGNVKVKVKMQSQWLYSHMLFIQAKPSRRLAQQFFRLKLQKKKRKNGYFLAVIAQLCDKKTFVCVR